MHRNETTHVAKDSGWAWFVLLGASLEMVLLVGIIKSSGILFVAFQDRFYSSSSMTSLLSTVQNICQSVMALVVMTCGVRITTCRTLLFVGSIITCIAYIITSQAEDIRLLLFSHGVLQGFGAGFMQPTALNMVGLYFEERRGLANSVAVSGGSIGGLIFAPMITKLLSTYGFQGCVLILAGVLLNGCVSGALFRPTSFYNKKVNRNIGLKGDKSDPIQHILPTDNHQKKIAANISAYETHSMVHDSNRYDCAFSGVNKTSLKDVYADIEKDRTHKAHSADDVFQKQVGRHKPNKNVQNVTSTGSSAICMSTPILFCSDDTFEEKYPKAYFEKQSPETQSSRWERISESNRSNREEKNIRQVSKVRLILDSFSEAFNLSLLKKRVFLAFLAQGSFICSGTVLAPVFIAPYARDIGVSRRDTATLVTLLSCIDLFSRILVGYISDKNWLRRSSIVAIAGLVVSISANLLRFCTNFTTLLGYTIVLGLVSGVYFALWPVVVIDYLTLANFQTCLGFMALVNGFSVAGAFYLIGFLRDMSGSYVLPHHVIGGATGLGAVILFLLPMIERL